MLKHENIREEIKKLLCRELVEKLIPAEEPSEEERKAIEEKDEIGRLINAEATELCLISVVTQGLNIVKSIMDWKKGDNIVVTDLGYPATTVTWLPLRERGIEVKRVNHVNGRINVSDFEKLIDDNTKIVMVDRTYNVTGYTHTQDELKAIADLAPEHNGFLVDDNIQSLGAIEHDVKKTGEDFMISGSFKWLIGPRQAGVFYIRKDLIDQFESPYTNYLSIISGAGELLGILEDPDHDNIKSWSRPLVNTAQKFDRHTVYHSAAWGFHAAIKYINDLEIKKIEKRVRRLSKYCIEELMDLDLEVWTPLEEEHRAGIVTYSTGSPEKDRRSFQALSAVNIVVALRYVGGVGGVRLSTHFFNNEADIDCVLGVIKRQLK